MKLLRALWDKWKPIARVIADFQARVLLSLLYVLFVAPIGLVIRAVSDPLHLKNSPDGWAARRTESGEKNGATQSTLTREELLEAARRQS